MSFGEMIIKFTGIAIFLLVMQLIVPVISSSFLIIILGIIVIGVGVYCFYLRVQWDIKLIKLAKEREEKEELKQWRKWRNHKSRLKRTKKKP